MSTVTQSSSPRSIPSSASKHILETTLTGPRPALPNSPLSVPHFDPTAPLVGGLPPFASNYRDRIFSSNVGIDTIKVVGRVLDFNKNAFFHTTYTRTPEWSRLEGAWTKLPSGVVLHLTPRAKSNASAWMELSVPNFLFDTNIILATPEETHKVIEDLAAEARNYLHWAEPPGSFSVNRIDLTKHFLFEHQADVDSFVNAQLLLSLPYNPDGHLLTGSGHSTYLRRGSRDRWMSVAYGKGAELQAQACSRHLTRAERARLLDLAEITAHILRNETMLRRPVLQRTVLATVEGISTAAIDERHRHFFDRAGFDREVGGIDKLRLVYDDLASDGERKAFESLLTMLMMEVLKRPTTKSKNTRSKYRRLANKLGLSAADVTLREGTLVLDYDAGRLVAIHPDQRAADNGSNTAPSGERAQPLPSPGISLDEAEVLATGQQLDLGLVPEKGTQGKAQPISDEDIDRWSQWWQDEDGWAAPLLVGPEDSFALHR